MTFQSFPISTPSQFIILDVEFLADLILYERYRRRDLRPSICRWPFRRVMSASVMAVTVTDGVWTVDDFRSFTQADERDLIRSLFNWTLERPAHRVVTWSGAAEDLSILKCAAMQFGFVLPRQFRQNERDRLGFLHWDLELILKAGSGSHVHMLEFAVRLGIAAKMAGSAGQVPHLVAEGNFEAIGFISESDILTCALLLASHLVTLGQVTGLKAAHFVTMKYVRDRREFAPYHRKLGNYVARVEQEMIAEGRQWLEVS